MNTTTDSRSIAQLIAHVVSECSAIDVEERFCSMLDECYSFEKVGGPFAYMSPSRVLSEVDPTAYRCGVSDYSDGEDWNEIEGDYYETRDVENARGEFIDGLNDELSDLRDELTDALEDEEPIEEDEKRLESQIAELESFISECEKYSF